MDEPSDIFCGARIFCRAFNFTVLLAPAEGNAWWVRLYNKYFERQTRPWLDIIYVRLIALSTTYIIKVIPG